MKLKNMSFTKKTLEDIDACQEAIDFCERNGLFCKTQIKNLEITGEYNSWADWLRSRINRDLEYNTAGNLTKITYSNGTVRTHEYDTTGNLTKITCPYVGITVYTYEKTENEFTMTCNGRIVLKLYNLEGWA